MSESVSVELKKPVDHGSSNSSQEQPQAKPLKVLVAASGTGGHLIPALHIMRAIKAANPDAVIECIGAGKPLEEKLLVGNGYRRHIISTTGVKRRGVIGLVQFALKLPGGILQCFKLMRSFKPDVVIGVGGYVSVLPVIVARFMRIPTWAHEAELKPGLANKVLGYFADRMSVSFAETTIKGRVKTVFTGHPVRPELASVNRDATPQDTPRRLLILGGSQGARGLDQVVPEIGDLLRDGQVEVVHQCRPENCDLVVNAYRAAQVKASVVSFIDDMAGAYEWSDIIISRAGASSVAEIGVVNRPTIFVPYPFQQGTHQTDNAQALARANKALVVEELPPEFGRRLKEALAKLLNKDGYLAIKSAEYKPVGLSAADQIAAGIAQLARPSYRA